MKVNIQTTQDSFFKLEEGFTPEIPVTGEVTMEVETPTEEISMEAPAPPQHNPNAVPVNQYKATNSFNLFEGTSWAGTHQGPGNIGR